MKVTPVARVAKVFNSLKNIVNYRRSTLKKPSFKVGDRVECIGFEGRPFLGTVTLCEEVDNGYAKFIRVSVKLDLNGSSLNINWSLFPYRIKSIEENK